MRILPRSTTLSNTINLFSIQLESFQPFAIINQNIPINSRYKFLFNGMYVRPESQYWFTRLPQKKRKHGNHPRLPRPMPNPQKLSVPDQIGKIIAIDYKKKTVTVEWLKFDPENDNLKSIRGPGEINAKIKTNNAYIYSIGLRRIVHLELVGLNISD